MEASATGMHRNRRDHLQFFVGDVQIALVFLNLELQFSDLFVFGFPHFVHVPIGFGNLLFVRPNNNDVYVEPRGPEGTKEEAIESERTRRKTNRNQIDRAETNPKLRACTHACQQQKRHLDDLKKIIAENRR